MNTLKSYKLLYTKNIFLLLVVSLININCEHCDDEDYTRKQEENIAQYQDPKILTGEKE